MQTFPGTTRFFLSIHLPHLPRMIPCSYWASTWLAALPSCIASYAISVRQTRDLPAGSIPASSFLRIPPRDGHPTFGYILPTTGRTPDLHRLETNGIKLRKNENSLDIQLEMCGFFANIFSKKSLVIKNIYFSQGG